MIEADGDGTKEIKRRLAMACNKWTDIEKHMESNNKKKLRITRTCIFPTDVKRGPLTKTLKNASMHLKTNAIENITRISWTVHRANQSIAVMNLESHLGHS